MSSDESDTSESYWSDNTPDGLTADECVTEEVSYSCPSCGNDSYGDIHDDCYGTCAMCGYYFEWNYLKRFKKENSRYYDERLCKSCTREEKEILEDSPDIKEPEE